MKQGELYQIKVRAFRPVLNGEIVEIVRTYNKRDIDPMCVESVAIVSMVEALVISGPGIGKTVKMSTRTFNRSFERLANNESR